MSGACGNCTLCCTLMRVAMDPPKPERVACRHCADAGCAIYVLRPKPCAEFQCLWLGSQDMPGRLSSFMRPDRTGIVLEINSAANIIAHCAWPDAWKREPMLTWLKGAAARTTVMLELGGETLLLAPDGTTERLIRVGVDKNSNERLYVRQSEVEAAS